MDFYLFLIAFCHVLTYSNQFTILVANDMHAYNFYYTEPQCSTQQNTDKCSKTKSSDNIQTYKYGSPGKNPPMSLVNLMFTQMNKQLKNPDILLLLGDFPAHPYAQDLNKPYEDSIYDQLKLSIKLVTKEAKTAYPSTIILPVLGNNDFKYNYQVPKSAEKEEYYNFLFKLWFEDHKVNSLLPQFDQIRKTFLIGGFYKLDFPDNLRVIVLNTMYYALANKENNDPAATFHQLKWFKFQLKQAKENGLQVVLIYHVFPGYCYGNPLTYNFKETYSKFFEKILREYRKSIIMIISSHTHVTSFRARRFLKRTRKGQDKTIKRYGFYANTLISPAITPVYKNNPGFSTFFLDRKTTNYTINDMLYTHFNLYKYNKAERDSEFSKEIDPFPYFFNYSFTKTYRVKDLTANSILGALDLIESNTNLFKEHLMLTLGFNDTDLFETAANNSIVRFGLVHSNDKTWSKWKINDREMCKYFCVMKEIKENNFEICINRCQKEVK